MRNFHNLETSEQIQTPLPSTTSGILLVDKPVGISSQGAVSRIRWKTKIKKVGHAGTLDPLANGLLVVLLGKATKSSSVFMGHDKVYQAEITFGVTTSTDDAEGEILEQKDASSLSEQSILEACQHFEGEQLQMPPRFCARKINGVPMYKLAVKGKSFERKPALICIQKIKILEWKFPVATLEIHCSKGTYIRSLARDLGEFLKCGAFLSGLRRLQSGNFKISQALSLEEIMNLDEEGLVKKILPIEGEYNRD